MPIKKRLIIHLFIYCSVVENTFIEKDNTALSSKQITPGGFSIFHKFLCIVIFYWMSFAKRLSENLWNGW